MTTETLAADEIVRLTGVTQRAAQLRRLRAAGFFRARIERGQVVLERPHYEAVCRGAAPIVAREPIVKSFRSAA